jgi:hypothetical protein
MKINLLIGGMLVNPGVIDKRWSIFQNNIVGIRSGLKSSSSRIMDILSRRRLFCIRKTVLKIGEQGVLNVPAIVDIVLKT